MRESKIVANGGGGSEGFGTDTPFVEKINYLDPQFIASIPLERNLPICNQNDSLDTLKKLRGGNKIIMRESDYNATRALMIEEFGITTLHFLKLSTFQKLKRYFKNLFNKWLY